MFHAGGTLLRPIADFAIRARCRPSYRELAECTLGASGGATDTDTKVSSGTCTAFTSSRRSRGRALGRREAQRASSARDIVASGLFELARFAGCACGCGAARIPSITSTGRGARRTC